MDTHTHTHTHTHTVTTTCCTCIYCPVCWHCPPLHSQVVTQYGDHDVPHVLEACERMEAHLTAAGEGQGAI